MNHTEFVFFETWADIHNNRLNWAFEAREAFLQKFDPEFQHLITDSGAKAAFVALYGNTQVGKTTLILKLLGIREDKFADIETILRAGRKRNVSSTSTAVIYLRSPDDFFHLILPQVKRLECLDEHRLVTELDNLRKDLEFRSSVSDERKDTGLPYNVFIKIPSRYFQETEPAVNINIIDLPGLGGDPSEKRHLEYVMARNLPLSTLILLVIKLNDKAVSLDGLEHVQVKNWRSMPQAFRIVTTHTLSNLMAEDEATLGRMADKNDLVRHVRSEFHRTLLTDEAELPAIYPLEYGHSWEALTPKPEFARFHPVINELIQDLRDDLQRFVTPHQKLMLTAALHTAILKEAKDETDKRRQQLDEAQRKLAVIDDLLNTLHAEAEQANADIKKLESERASDQAETQIAYSPGNNSHLEKRSEYESYARSETDRIDSLSTEKWRSLPVDTGLPYSEDWIQNGDIKNIIRSCRSNLLSYCADMLWINNFFRQGERRRTCSTMLSTCAGEVESKMRELLQEKVRLHNDDIDRKISSLQRRTQYARERIKTLQDDRQAAYEECCALDENLRDYVEQSARQLKHASEFHQYIDDAFAQQESRIKKQWTATATPAESLLLSTMEYALLVEDYHILNQTKNTR